MKLALIGYGKMGRMVEALARERGHAIVAIVDPQEGTHRKIDSHSIREADLCLEFTHPEAAVGNIRACMDLKKKMVVGTTGWFEHLPKVKSMVQEAKTGLLYAPNFAIGIFLFMRLATVAAKLLDRFSHYDVAIVEEHHNQKADRPSGTAYALTKVLQAEMERFKEGQTPEVCSLRCGSIPGTHKLIFDSPADTLMLTHTARSRRGMAEGALLAAEWLHDKNGFYTLEDMLAEKLEEL